MRANLTAKGRKLAGILVVPAWRRALLRQRVAEVVKYAAVLRRLGEARAVVGISANPRQNVLAAQLAFRLRVLARLSRLPGWHRLRKCSLGIYRSKVNAD
jgi:hypothetical protein